jgi:hypothetical protein
VDATLIERAADAQGHSVLLWPAPPLRLSMERMQPLSADVLLRLQSIFSVAIA